MQYTWLRTITDAHADFWQVTQDGLDWALANSDFSNDAGLRKRLLQLYWELSSYPEVSAMLNALKKAEFNTTILSNGSPDMLNGAVKSADIGDVLDDVLSVETAGVFKPHRSVYDLVGRRFGCTPDQVLFVSSNGWDAAASAGYGFHAVWVNRAGEPMDCLPWIPCEETTDLTPIPDIASSI